MNIKIENISSLRNFYNSNLFWIITVIAGSSYGLYNDIKNCVIHNYILPSILLFSVICIASFMFYLKGYINIHTTFNEFNKWFKSEVITPEKVVEKMINKIPDKEYESAKTILLVNEKSAEFFRGLCKKFNNKKSIIEKCRIIPSSEIGMMFVKKMLKTMGLIEYINTIILDIGDVDNNGYYDVKDFLAMKNNDILDMNSGKKFDICLMNPPYGGSNNKKIHLEFVSKILDIAKKQVTVMPFSFINKTNNNMDNKYNDKIDDFLLSVDEIDSKLFAGTSMANVGIYEFSNSKNDDDNIKINYVDGNVTLLKSLDIKSDFNEYEESICEFLLKNGSNPFVGGRSGGSIGMLSKKHYPDLSRDEYKELQKERIIINCKKIKNYFEKHKNCVALTVAKALGGPGNTSYFSKNCGNIFDNYNELEKHLTNICSRGGFNILFFNSINAAENCKYALKNPLFKFILLRTQKDQNLTFAHVYKYVPNIDWSNDKVKTDEGLLELCGCPKDKCKEYAEYCKRIIDKHENNQ